MTDALLYVRTGRELEAMDALAALGIPHWRGEQIEFRRSGRRRTAEPHTLPALPNYVWCHQFTADRYQEAVTVAGVARTIMPLTEASRRALEAFSRAADARLAAARKAIGSREAIAEFREGEVIEIRDGALAGQLARFRRVVQSAHEMHAMLLCDVDMMGGLIPVRVDPLDARRIV